MPEVTSDFTVETSVWPDNATPQAPIVSEPDTSVEEPVPVATRDEKGKFVAAHPAEPDAPVVDSGETPPPVEPDAEKPETEESRADKRRRNDPQKRIDQAVGRQRAAEAIADQERQTRQMLEKRLADLEAKIGGAPVVPTGADEAKPVEAAPTTDLKPEDFQTYEEYLAALAKSVARTEFEAERKRLADEAKAEQDRLESEARDRAVKDVLAKSAERFEQARQTRPDFEDQIDPDLALSLPMRDAMIASDHGPDVAVYLSQHKDEHARILNMPPGPALLEMGRIVERVAAQVAQATPGSVTPAPARSTAPPPIKPVGSGSPTSTTPVEKLSLDEYHRRRNAELKQRGHTLT